MTVTREHVVRMLLISGYNEVEARELTIHLIFPADLDHVERLFNRLGLNTDSLVDRMGGSP